MRIAAAPPLLAAFALALAACSGQPEQAPPESPAPRENVAAPVQEPEDEVARLLALAARGEPAAAADARLQAAAELIRRGEGARASSVLDPLETAQLDSSQWTRLTALRARLALDAGDPRTALERLENPALETESAGAARAVQVELAFVRADVFAALGRPLDAARERTAVQARLSDDAERRDNVLAILRALGAVDMGMLEQETRVAASDDWRGWLELAGALRDLRRGPAEQSAALAQWQQRYALIAPLQAAARDFLPAMRERIVQPARVAILLPLSGRAAAGAQAVLNGYLAEHMHQLGNGEQPPPVAVIDTDAGGFAAAYAAAISDGATLVIGPLLKDDLAAFGPALQVSVPTLALNFAESLPTEPTKLREFGLDATDEVAQMVAAASEQGLTNALLLSDGTEVSRRQAADFERLWRAGNARLVGTLELQELNEFRHGVEQSLLLEQSRQRSAALSLLLGRELVTEPRRRQDLDLVAVFAAPVAARSIRPLVSFLYAGDLPVWSTSQAYGARANPREDRDLDDVRFLDLPWFSGAERPLRESLRESVPAGGLQRLAALGVDACRLQSRLQLLDWLNDAGLTGATGALVLDGGVRLRRLSQWYVFDNGVARPERQRVPLATPIPNDLSREGETSWQDTSAAAPPPSDAPPRTMP